MPRVGSMTNDPKSAKASVAAEEFVPAPPPHRVGALARQGVLWTFALIVVRHGIHLASTAVLARLLTPADYGLLAMTATLTALFQVFSDMGLTWATVQRRELTVGQISSLFWINAAVGLGLWLLCIASGPLLAWFYAEPRLSSIAALSGASFLLGGIGAQPAALLRRDLNFRAIALAEASRTLVQAVVAVLLAMAGWRYWSLVVAGLLAEVVRVSVLFRASGFRPRRPALADDTVSLITFGGWMTATGLTSYASQTFDKVLVGKFWGADQLGYYSRAWFLMQLPAALASSAIAEVMTPALCAVQADRDRLGAAYRKGLQANCLVGAPVAGGLVAAGGEFVRLVYGPRWSPVTPILRWLAVASLFSHLYSSVGWLFLSVGKVRERFCFFLAKTLFTLGACWSVAKHGPVALAAVMATVTILITPPALWLAHRSARLPVGPTWRAVRRPMLATLAMLTTVLAVGSTAAHTGVEWLWVLGFKALVGILVYGLLTRRQIGIILGASQVGSVVKNLIRIA